MFSSSKKPSPPLNNNVKKGTPSIIAEGLTINGNLVSDGEVHVDGVVNGDVTVGQLAVGENARLTGEVIADSVMVRGEILGRIRAKSVELAKTAKVRGDIWHELLSIAAGAKVEGLCKYAESPREDTPRLDLVEQPAKKADGGSGFKSEGSKPEVLKDLIKESSKPEPVKARASNVVPGPSAIAAG